MIPEINSYCTGCSACVLTCASKALSMGADENGFYKPQVNAELCTNCHNCEKICPLNSLENPNVHTPPLYVFNNNSEKARESSTAGGFQILAKHFLAQGGKVAGAAWGKNWRCEHILVDNENDLKRLYKSKYVQSYMGDIFKQVKSELDKGIKILFSGLPCQIAGLYAYVGRKYENLYTVDLLCNNAPSAKHFASYLEDKYGIENISGIEFRHKDKQNNTTENILKVTLKNGEQIFSNLWSDNSYCELFVSRMLVGEHCENCAFARFPRLGDLTIGDIFGAEAIDARFQGLKSQSALINSPKGKELFENIKENVHEYAQIPLQVLVNMHPVLQNKWTANPKRNQLFDLLKTHSFQRACNIIYGKYDVGIVGVPTNPNFGGGLTYLALKWTLEDLGKKCLMISPPGQDLPWLPKRLTNWKVKPYKDAEMAYYPSKDAMRELNYHCDMFLIGSDQLYSTHFPNIGIYGEMQEFPSLDWVWDSKKKSAYSASFGEDNLSCPQDMKNRMGYFLRKFDCFSVRERSAAKLCKQEFGIDAPFVLDPVFMCEKTHWNDLIKIGKKTEGITAYVLDKSDKKMHFISDVATKLNTTINVIGDRNIDMEDWLSSFATADFIITDSFHGTCFAIIFNKPFIVMANTNRGLTRFRLLEEFGLESRLAHTYEDAQSRLTDLLKPIDWKQVNKRVEKLKNISFEVLKEALSPVKKFPSDYDVLYEALLAERMRVNQLSAIVNSLMSQPTAKKMIKKQIKLPKIIGRLICCFIPKKKNRKRFRKNHIK